MPGKWGRILDQELLFRSGIIQELTAIFIILGGYRGIKAEVG